MIYLGLSIKLSTNTVSFDYFRTRGADLMRFITGSFQLPPLGLPEPVEVRFINGCAAGCKCRPTVSTCKLVLKIPVHTPKFENMKEMMTSAMLEGFGFGKL